MVRQIRRISGRSVPCQHQLLVAAVAITIGVGGGGGGVVAVHWSLFCTGHATLPHTQAMLLLLLKPQLMCTIQHVHERPNPSVVMVAFVVGICVTQRQHFSIDQHQLPQRPHLSRMRHFRGCSIVVDAASFRMLVMTVEKPCNAMRRREKLHRIEGNATIVSLAIMVFNRESMWNRRCQRTQRC